MKELRIVEVSDGQDVKIQWDQDPTPVEAMQAAMAYLSRPAHCSSDQVQYEVKSFTFLANKDNKGRISVLIIPRKEDSMADSRDGQFTW